MTYITGSSRHQTTLFPESLNELIAQDHPVRVIDAFVDSLISENWGEYDDLYELACILLPTVALVVSDLAKSLRAVQSAKVGLVHRPVTRTATRLVPCYY